MKKSILFMPVLISLSIVGCTMNYNQPSSDKVIHQSSLNIDKLINANAADVEKSLGSPYYATYYIDADKLKSKNINSISIEDLKEDVSLLASYNDNQSSNSYLHIYYEDGVVKDALYGPYKIDNLDNVISASNISNADYKVSFFKNRGAICYNDFSIDNAKKEFVGKPISNFNNTYKLKSANFVASTINESDTLYFYPLVNHDVIHKDQYKHPNYSSNENDLANYYKSAVVLYTKDDKIQSIQIADKQFFYKLINDVFNK